MDNITRRQLIARGLKVGTGLLGAGALAVAPQLAHKASAAHCRRLGTYTDYYMGKPILYIWNGSARPDHNKLSLRYHNGLYYESVPSPSDWGVRTDAPQVENSSGWYGYFIASRWYYLHSWNDDWRWYALYCS